MNENHERYMRECIELSKQAIACGNPPFGSVLVHGNEVVFRATNTTVTDNNPLKHAELNVLNEAMERFDPDILPESTLYSSNEPCVMCAGAIYWSGIRKVVNGMSGKALVEIRGFGLDVYGHEILSSGTDKVIVIQGVLEKEIIDIHERFWEEFAN